MDKPYNAHHTLFSSGLMMAQSYCDAVPDGSKMATSAREVSINHIDLCNFMNSHNPRYIDIIIKYLILQIIIVPDSDMAKN